MAAGVAAPGAARGGRGVRVRPCGPLNPTGPSGCGRFTHLPLISTGLLPAGAFQCPRLDTIPPAGTCP